MGFFPESLGRKHGFALYTAKYSTSSFGFSDNALQSVGRWEAEVSKLAPEGQIQPAAYLVNKVLLEHSCARLFTDCLWELLCQRSIRERDHVPRETLTHLLLVLHRKLC